MDNFLSTTIKKSDGTFKLGIEEFIYVNQEKYQGSYNQDQQRSGKGIFYFSNRDIYFGMWENDLPSG